MFRQQGRIGTQWFMALYAIVVLPGTFYFLMAKMPYDWMHMLAFPYMIGAMMICIAIQIKTRLAEEKKLYG